MQCRENEKQFDLVFEEWSHGLALRSDQDLSLLVHFIMDVIKEYPQRIVSVGKIATAHSNVVRALDAELYICNTCSCTTMNGWYFGYT